MKLNRSASFEFQCLALLFSFFGFASSAHLARAQAKTTSVLLSPVLSSLTAATIATPEISISDPIWHSGDGSELATQPFPQQLLRASRVFSGQQGVTSITLTGQVNRIAGAINETGQATLVARSDGSSSVELDLGESGARTETQGAFADGQHCSWARGEGSVHTMPAHNCRIPLAWFLPEVGLFSGSRPAGSFQSVENEDGKLEYEFTLTPTMNVSDEQAASLLRKSTYDLQIDPNTYLPSTLSYAVHPDSNAGIDIPVKVAYSDYRPIDGVEVPFHIERYLNGVLSLDITLTDALVTR